MKRILILMVTHIIVVNVNCQEKGMPFEYFVTVPQDLAIQTQVLMSQCHKMQEKGALPDSLALFYFFDSNPKNMQGTFEGCNADDNTYTYAPYIKKVYPLSKKTCSNIIILGYGIESMLPRAMCSERNKVANSLIVSDYSDNFGNSIKHGTIFQSNCIVTLQIREEPHSTLTECILYKGDCSLQTFIEVKQIRTAQAPVTLSEKHQNVLNLLGITQDGELK